MLAGMSNDVSIRVFRSLLRPDEGFVTGAGDFGLRYDNRPSSQRPAAKIPMSGLDSHTPIPTEIKLHQQSKVMEVTFADGNTFRLPFEFLRVYSPSAEVRGHGPGQETLQTGKRNVDILSLEPVGNYAVRPTFSDGHDTGIYSWDVIYDLGIHQESYWQAYLARLAAAGASRDVDSTTLPPKSGGCGGKH
jgi:DUF971 family protein